MLSTKITNNYPKMKLKTKSQIKDITIVIVYLIPIIFLVAVIAQYAVTITKELSMYEYQVQNFIKIEPKATASHLIIKEAEAKPVDPATLSTEDYICYVFGKDCNMALAVSQAENGTRQCDRFGVNTNKTIDVGIFQINSVHLKKGWTLTDLVDCHKNIDYAYEIYKAQGWSPWVAYSNGAYKKFLR